MTRIYKSILARNSIRRLQPSEAVNPHVLINENRYRYSGSVSGSDRSKNAALAPLTRFSTLGKVAQALDKELVIESRDRPKQHKRPEKSTA